MPIKINLLAESQHAEDMRRRDPVKRGIWIAGFLVFVVLLYIAKLQMDVWHKKSEFTQIEQSLQKQEPDFKKVTDNKREVADVEAKLALLDQLHTNRFLWGNVLNALQYTMVSNILVTKMRADQTYGHADGAEKMINDKKTRLPGYTMEKVTLWIEAKDTSSSDDGYQKFKEALSKNDFFLQKLHLKDGFVTEGNVSQPIPDPSDPSKQFRTFTLKGSFPEVRHDE